MIAIRGSAVRIFEKITSSWVITGLLLVTSRFERVETFKSTFGEVRRRRQVGFNIRVRMYPDNPVIC